MNVFPDFEGLLGSGELKQTIGALLTVVLIIAVLMVVISAIIWGLAASHSNPTTATKGRIGVLVAAGAAALAGAGVAWVNWLILLGGQL